MKLFSLIGSLILLSTSVFSSTANAAIDIDASIIHLRTNCTEDGSPINNCFTDLPTLNTWVWNTRTPSPSPTSPLKVEIGPGTFTGSFTCNNQPWIGQQNGSVTLQGSGVENTIIQNASSPISTSFCKFMVFNDMTLKNTGNLFGVKNLGGSTFWYNINIEGIGYAWFDSPNACNSGGTHYWFNTKLIVTTAAGSTVGFYIACKNSAHWFFASEITAKGSSGVSTPIKAVGGEVHVYGSVIRALPEGNTSGIAVTANNGSEVHIHGTGIDTISTGTGNVTALSASGAGTLIHANESSYVLQSAGGLATRISSSGGASIAAPYLWQNGATPPNINTETGADSVVVTDTNDGHPHMLISDNTCAGKWFDVNANSCL